MRNSIILSVLLCSACVRPPDIPICRDLSSRQITVKDEFGIEDIILQPNPVCWKEIGESRCGYCTWTVSAKSQYVGEAPPHRLSGKTWSELRPSSVLLPADSYAQIKSYIMSACKKSKDCQKDIDKWRVKFEGLGVK